MKYFSSVPRCGVHLCLVLHISGGSDFCYPEDLWMGFDVKCAFGLTFHINILMFEETRARSCPCTTVYPEVLMPVSLLCNGKVAHCERHDFLKKFTAFQNEFW